MIGSFRDLDVYRQAYALMFEIHTLVKSIPAYERTDLVSQMRRASKSIPANIAEGWAKRRSEKEFKKFLDNALGSANEMEVHVEIAKDLAYIGKEIGDDLLDRYKKLGGMLVNLRNNWRTY